MLDCIRRAMVLCPVFVCILTGIAHSQDLTHPLVQGTIADTLNQPLEQVEVIVRDSTNRIVATAQTDSHGMYILHELDPNTSYHLVVRRIGFVVDSGTLMIPQVAGSQARITASADFVLYPIVSRLDTVNVIVKKNHSMFGKISNMFDKVQSLLDSFGNTLNKFCHEHQTGMNGISLCVDPSGVKFSFSWKPPIGDGPIADSAAVDFKTPFEQNLFKADSDLRSRNSLFLNSR
jgi:Carboxypeptidase regulatory-like domain